ncbi:hypothetical protein AB0O28_39400 [Microbispora sp. NPDC088329]|uniref:hypothetical protein n=1 Tax=Microbispora sp. NPDC088329 TaxID=3154869 RepID=UPI00343BAD65
MPEMRRPMGAGEALYSTLTGLSPRSEGKTTQARVKDALKRLMGKGEARSEGEAKRKLAEKVGVSVRTVQKWAKGQQEATNTARGNHADKLAAAQRAARLKPGRVEKMRAAGRAAPVPPGTQPQTQAGGDASAAAGAKSWSGIDRLGAGGVGLRLYGTVRVSDDERDRWISPGQSIPESSLGALIDRLVAEGPEAAGEELNKLLSYYVPGMSITNIEAIEY